MHELKIGDRILLIKVPDFDTGETKAILERVVREKLLVTIDEIDEYGKPWFSVELDGEDGVHSFAIMENESWVKFGEKRTFSNPALQHLADQIEEVSVQYFTEYNALAERSEKLYDEQQQLKKEYELLDQQSGLNQLLEQFAQISSKENKE